jgi:prephenate dehydrogenase
VVAELETILGDRYVGGHPMAGSHQSGPEHARADLFQGATYVLTPTARTGAEALHTVEELTVGLGAQPLYLAPGLHDEMVAFTSHLPHLLAYELAETGAQVQREQPLAARLAASGFRDTTRLADSDPELWSVILRANRGAVVRPLARFEARVQSFREALKRGPADELATALREARLGRARLLAARLPGSPPPPDVVCNMSSTPVT